MTSNADAGLRREAALEQVIADAIAVPSAGHGVTVRGAKIRYRRWSISGASGVPIILVHGMLAHSHWWDAVAGLLAPCHPIVALDLSGLGDSGRRDRYEREVHGEEIIAVADDAGFDNPMLVAHSYGGDPAMRSCIAMPNRFERLIVVDSRLPLPGVAPLGQPGAIAKLVRKSYPSREAALARFRLTPDSRLAQPLLLDHIARHSIRLDGTCWTWKFDATTAINAATDKFLDPANVKTPLIFINGSDSEIVTPDQVELTRRYFPDAPILNIAAAGHHVLVDQPLVLATLLGGLSIG